MDRSEALYKGLKLRRVRSIAHRSVLELCRYLIDDRRTRCTAETTVRFGGCIIAITVFTRISAAAVIKFFAPQVRRLIEGGSYLKIRGYKEIFSFNLMVYLPSVRKKNNKA